MVNRDIAAFCDTFLREPELPPSHAQPPAESVSAVTHAMVIQIQPQQSSGYSWLRGKFSSLSEHLALFRPDNALWLQEPGERMAAKSRHGKVQDGWVRQGIQLPAWLRERLSDEAAEKGHASIKVIGTTAIAMYLSLPKEMRDDLFIQVTRMIWRGGEEAEFTERQLLYILDYLMRNIRRFSQSDARDMPMDFWRWKELPLHERRNSTPFSHKGSAVEGKPDIPRLGDILSFDPKGDKSYIEFYKQPSLAEFYDELREAEEYFARGGFGEASEVDDEPESEQ